MTTPWPKRKTRDGTLHATTVSGGLAGGARGPWPPPADFFEGAPKFKKGAKNLMKLHGSITFFPATSSHYHRQIISGPCKVS